MRNVSTIYQREIKSYFYSPIAYVVISVFLIASGFFFAGNLQFWQEASLKGSLDSIQFFLLLLTPVITMKLFADETKSGTIETLMTSPVTDFDVVFGKFLAALSLYVVMILPTWIFVIFLTIFRKPGLRANLFQLHRPGTYGKFICFCWSADIVIHKESGCCCCNRDSFINNFMGNWVFELIW